MQSALPGEKVIYQDTLVTVTTSRVVIGGVTYAMANITSVRQFAQPPDTAGVVFLGILSLIFSGVMGLLKNWVTCLVFVALGIAALYWAGKQKPKHWVKIGTAGAETNALCDHDPMRTSRIVVAINEAIIARG